MNGLDEHLLPLLYGGEASSWLLGLMRLITVIGEGWIVLALFPLLLWHRPRRFAAYLLVTLLTDALLVYTVKHLVRRARPYQALPAIHALVASPPVDFSFPSGHSAGSFGLAVFVFTVVARGDGRTRRAVGLASALVFLALLVALSRVFLGVHYPTDILGGSILGAVLGFAGGEAYLQSLRRRLARARAQSPTGTGAAAADAGKT